MGHWEPSCEGWCWNRCDGPAVFIYSTGGFLNIWRGYTHDDSEANEHVVEALYEHEAMNCIDELIPLRQCACPTDEE